MKHSIVAILGVIAFGAGGLTPQSAGAAQWEGTGFWPVNTGRTFTTTTGSPPHKTVFFGVSPSNKVTTVATTADTFYASTAICTNGTVVTAPLQYEPTGSTVFSLVSCTGSGNVVTLGGAWVWQP